MFARQMMRRVARKAVEVRDGVRSPTPVPIARVLAPKISPRARSRVPGRAQRIQADRPRAPSTNPPTVGIADRGLH